MSHSFLYVPGDQPRFLERARAHRGAVILDLEDSVAPGGKAAALAAVLDFLRQPRGYPSWVRVNAGTEGLADAHALNGAAALDGIWVAKAESPSLIAEIAEIAGVQVGVLIESARGLLALPELLRPEPVTRLQLGEIDLAADLQLRGGAASDLDWFRHWIILHASAARVQAVGPVAADFRNLDGFRESSTALRNMGFVARACIHPSQVGVVEEVFGVSDEDLAAANRVVDEYEAALRENRGAYAADGVMVDAATIRHARRLTNRE